MKGVGFRFSMGTVGLRISALHPERTETKESRKGRTPCSSLGHRVLTSSTRPTFMAHQRPHSSGLQRCRVSIPWTMSISDADEGVRRPIVITPPKYTAPKA